MNQSDVEWLEARGFRCSQIAGLAPVWAFVVPHGPVFHAEAMFMPADPCGCGAGVKVSASYDVHPEFLGTGEDAESACHDLFIALIDAGDLTGAGALDAIMYPDTEACHA